MILIPFVHCRNLAKSPRFQQYYLEQNLKRYDTLLTLSYATRNICVIFEFESFNSFGHDDWPPGGVLGYLNQALHQCVVACVCVCISDFSGEKKKLRCESKTSCYRDDFFFF